VHHASALNFAETLENCASPAINSSRWHVRDNLLGTREWSPAVHPSAPSGESLGALDSQQ
jgi:hypothetical protein